jgi:ubiquinone biosynthesis protein
MELETDLRREAGAADAFAQIAAIDNFIKAPKVNWELSTKDVLTTEWVDGISLTDDRALIGQDSVKLADNITRAFLTTALEYGYFHADMHEGNLIVTQDGNICAVDFGIMGRLGKKEQRYLAEILYCFIKRDYRGAAKVHFDAGYVPSSYDIGEFGIALRAVGEPIWGKPASEVSMGRVLLQLFDVTEQFGMKLRPELVLLQKTMVQVEGVARSIDPGHDIWKSAQPIVERFMKREIGLEGIMETSKEHLTTLAQSIMKLPILIEKLEEFLEQQNKN